MTADALDAPLLSPDLGLIDEPPMDHTWWKPNAVHISGEGASRRIVGQYAASADEMSRVDERTTRDALAQFAALSSANEAKAMRFVRHHGQLGLTASGELVVPREMGGTFDESFADYVKYARLVDATCTFAANLGTGRPVHPEHRQALSDFFDEHYPRAELPYAGYPAGRWAFLARVQIGGVGRETDEAKRAQMAIHGVRNMLLTVANWWVEVGAVSPVLEWSDGGLGVRWSGELWGAIGVQLMLYVQERLGVPSCTHCRRPIRGKKGRPRHPGALPYCKRPPCQLAFARQRQRDRRARTRRPSSPRMAAGTTVDTDRTPTVPTKKPRSR